MKYTTEPPAELVQKYSRLYSRIEAAGGMRLTDVQIAMEFKSPGSAVTALTALETLGMLLWYEPSDKKYRVVKREDEVI